MLYGKTTKTILNPGSDKVYDIKAEIEKSKTFLENIRKAKTDAEKHPECQIKPSIRAQKQGRNVRPSSLQSLLLHRGGSGGL